MQTGAAGRVLKNFGVVLRGRGIAAVLTLSATALMANALPAAEFGLVILLHTYVLAVRGILNFRTWRNWKDCWIDGSWRCLWSPRN